MLIEKLIQTSLQISRFSANTTKEAIFTERNQFWDLGKSKKRDLNWMQNLDNGELDNSCQKLIRTQ